MNPLIKINVTAIGAINLIMNLHKLKIKLESESSSKTIFFLTMKPTNIAIIKPPRGNMIFDVNVSSKSKKVISKNLILEIKLKENNVPKPTIQVIKPILYVASILSYENLSIK